MGQAWGHLAKVAKEEQPGLGPGGGSGRPQGHNPAGVRVGCGPMPGVGWWVPWGQSRACWGKPF